jgi:beta-glucosidase/6-phospho-beta-glucosidase/beta-galactosidase
VKRTRAELFQTFFMGGFECSTHRRSRDRARLDMIAATRHDQFVMSDYRALTDLGIKTARDGLRWHLIEQRPGRYDFSSFLPMLRAAQATGVEVIWDLCHYGWPDDIDVFSPAFVDRFARYAAAACALLRDETDGYALLAPINEMSFLSWAGGEVANINPFAKERGYDLKTQLVRATIAAADVIWDQLPHARIVQCEPAIHIVADPKRPQDHADAEGYRIFQFEALDMLCGRSSPELGGRPKYLDILGVNYYGNNQWIHNGRTLAVSDPLYRPFREILREYYRRYGRPMFISETGCEDDKRPEWLAYIAGEAWAAKRAGAAIEGLCLYPIVNHPGWDNERHCHNGLFDYADDDGRREMYPPLGRELSKQQSAFEEFEQWKQAAS